MNNAVDSDYNIIKSEINIKQNGSNYTTSCILKTTLLNDQWAKEEINKKFLKLSGIKWNWEYNTNEITYPGCVRRKHALRNTSLKSVIECLPNIYEPQSSSPGTTKCVIV